MAKVMVHSKRTLLNATGATIEVLELKGDQPETEETVKSWLRATINQIEEQSTNRLNS